MDEIKKFKTFGITFISGVESSSISTVILYTEGGQNTVFCVNRDRCILRLQC